MIPPEPEITLQGAIPTVEKSCIMLPCATLEDTSPAVAISSIPLHRAAVDIKIIIRCGR